jgi:molybdopterin synthase sulfur carrier subunit
MAGEDRGSDHGAGTVTVRYWASARSAAGTAEDRFAAPTTLAEVFDAVLERHRDRPRLKDVVGICSVLVGDRPVGTVEPLPPFAGG